MESAAAPIEGSGETLVLHDREALEDSRTPAYRRLEQTLGGNLTRLLVSALATRLLRRGDDA
jgi:hypothetical protein